MDDRESRRAELSGAARNTYAGAVLPPDANAVAGVASAYSGTDDERHAVRLVISGDALGYIGGEVSLMLLDVEARDLGHSAAQTLPGVSYYQPFEPRCSLPRCPANPIVAARFDAVYPAHCRMPPDQLPELAGR
jgi:hypothetical protein